MRHFSETHRVYLGTLIDDPDDRQYADTVRAQVHDCFFGGIDRRLAYVSALPGLVSGTPLSFGFYAHSGLRRWVRRVMEEVRPEVVFVSSTNMVPYVMNATYRPSSLIVDYVDVDSEKWRAYAEAAKFPFSWLFRNEARLVLEQEIAIAGHADWVTFVTEEETALFNQVAPGHKGRARALLSGVDSDFFAPGTDLEPAFDVGPPTFVFTGTMDYPPNEQAVEWFARTILPIVRRRFAETRFYIVGSRPSAKVQKLSGLPGVHVTGRVPDVRNFLAYSTAAVAPLRIARGIQNKVLEALSMGLPVIATEGALTGINARDGTHVLQADTAEDFAAACMNVIEHSETGRRLGDAARGLIDDGWSWNARLSAFDGLIQGEDPAAPPTEGVAHPSGPQV